MVFSGRLVQAAPGIQGLLVADLHQRLGHVIHVLDVHPAGHVGHASPRAGGGEQQDRQELGPQELPVVGVLGPMAADVGRISEHAADPSGVAVAGAVGQGGPPGSRHAAQAEGVVDPDGPEAGSVGACGPENVGLIDVVTKFPCHSKMAGMTRPWVLNDPGGPKARTEWHCSTAR
jgi:hypothetical protein